MSARPGLYGGQPVMVVPTVINNNPIRESALKFLQSRLQNVDGSFSGNLLVL
jgi:hypothetical protein